MFTMHCRHRDNSAKCQHVCVCVTESPYIHSLQCNGKGGHVQKNAANKCHITTATRALKGTWRVKEHVIREKSREIRKGNSKEATFLSSRCYNRTPLTR
jgi:hypothetical protein